MQPVEISSGLEVLSHFVEGEGSLGFAEPAKKQQLNKIKKMMLFWFAHPSTASKLS